MRFSRRAKRRIIVIGAAGLLLVAAGGMFKVLRGVQQSRLQTEAKEKGLAAYDDGRFEQSLEHLGYVIAHDKTDVEVILAFADARARTPLSNGKHVMEALGYYRAAVDLLDQPTTTIPASMDRDEQRRECWSRMLEMYAMLGMRFEVTETANSLLNLNPNNVEALQAKMQVQYAERQFDAALRAVTKLVDLQPQELRWREMYLALMRESGRSTSELLTQTSKWMVDYQGDGRYHVLEAAILADDGRYEEATTAIQNAAVFGASTQDVLNKMVSLLDALGQYELAQDVIARADERYPNATWVQQVVVRRLWQANKIDEALQRLDGLLDGDQEAEPSLLRLQALCLLSDDRVEEAVDVLSPLTASANEYDRADEADRAWARAMIAYSEHDGDSFDAILREVRHALVLQPRDPVLHSIMGKTYADMGEDALAVQYYETAHRLDPSWLAAGVTYIESMLRIGRVGEAYRQSVTMLRRQPTDVIAPFVLCAQAYMQLMRSGQKEQIALTGGASPDIVGMLETLHEQRPNDPTVAGLLVEGYLVTGRDDLARRFISSVQQNAGAAPQLLIELAQIGRRYGIETAEALIDKAANDAPDSLAVAYARANMLAGHGKTEEGLAVLDRAIEAAGDEPAGRMAARRARLQYLMRIEHPQAGAELQAFVKDFSSQAGALSFALEQQLLWDDQTAVRSVIDDLSEIVGRSSQQVRLAEANFLMRYRADDEAELARSMVLINGVLEESPDSLAALTLLANASLLGERPSIQRAIVNLQRAVERYPGATSLYPVFINLLQRQGDYAAADRYLERFASLAEHQPRWQHEEIRLLRAQGDFERALIRASSMINEQSGETEKLSLANLYRRSGRIEDAAVLYEELLSAPQPSALVIERAAEFYALTGDVNRADKLLQTYQPSDDDQWRKELMLGRFAMQYGDPAEALPHLQAAAQAQPGNANVLYELARYYLAAKQYGAAHETAMTGLGERPSHDGLRTVLALSTIRLGPDAQSRTAAFWKGLDHSGDALTQTLSLLQDVRFVDGRAQPTAGNLDDAQELVAQNSSYLPAWMLAISLMADAGRQNDAIELARRAVGRFPTEAQVAQWATNMLMADGQWQDALMEAQEWRRRTLDDPIDADVAMASILLELDRAADAMTQIKPHSQRIIDQRERRPGRVGPWLRTLLANSQWSDASQLASQLVPEGVNWRRMWMQLISDMSVQHAYDVLSMIEKNVEQPREYLELAMAWSNLAGRSGELSHYARADALALRAAELDASLQTQVLMTRGLIAQGQGDDVAAERYYRNVIERDADNAPTLNNLAFLLVENGRRYEQALPYIQHAVELSPNHPDLLDTLGQVLSGLGRHDEAVEALRKARQQRPRDMTIGLNLADALLASGAAREAGFVLEDVDAELELTWPRDEAIVQRLQELRSRVDDQGAQAGSYDQSGSTSAANHATVIDR